MRSARTGSSAALAPSPPSVWLYRLLSALAIEDDRLRAVEEDGEEGMA